ncbi:MAG: sirohydrochlorin chelatase [Fidelibacterota bacterium]
MRTVIVLAMHGAPPADFPGDEMKEFFALDNQVGHSHGPSSDHLHQRYVQLEHKMRTWPRTPDNDPFHAGSRELGASLEKTTGRDVVVGFNEFCAPSVDEALDEAVHRGGDRVVVITPMMTRGGEHSEKDIPAAIERARNKHPSIEFTYVWPFETSRIADFLAEQTRRALDGKRSS